MTDNMQSSLSLNCEMNNKDDIQNSQQLVRVVKNDDFDFHLSLSELQHESEFLDCTLAVNSHQKISAHKFVLASASNYFRSMLKCCRPINPSTSYPSIHSVLVMPQNVKFEMLKKLIDFIYQGETSLPQSDMNDFMALGQLLEVKGLMDQGHSAIQPQSPSFFALQCPRCPTRFGGVDKFQEHMSRTHGVASSSNPNEEASSVGASNSKMSFSCEICSKVFTSRQKVTAHKKRVHKDDPSQHLLSENLKTQHENHNQMNNMESQNMLLDSFDNFASNTMPINDFSGSHGATTAVTNDVAHFAPMEGNYAKSIGRGRRGGGSTPRGGGGKKRAIGQTDPNVNNHNTDVNNASTHYFSPQQQSSFDYNTHHHQQGDHQQGLMNTPPTSSSLLQTFESAYRPVGQVTPVQTVPHPPQSSVATSSTNNSFVDVSNNVSGGDDMSKSVAETLQFTSPPIFSSSNDPPSLQFQPAPADMQALIAEPVPLQSGQSSAASSPSKRTAAMFNAPFLNSPATTGANPPPRPQFAPQNADPHARSLEKRLAGRVSISTTPSSGGNDPMVANLPKMPLPQSQQMSKNTAAMLQNRKGFSITKLAPDEQGSGDSA